MKRYKQYKQTNNLLHVFLLAFFTFTSLFSVTGVVYSLITVGIGSPLFLLCSLGFATCTTLSAYNAYAIHNNITHRRSGKAPKKETACSTNKECLNLEDHSKDLIDLSDPPVSNEEYDAQQHIPNDTLKINNKEILTPEVVENAKQNNKPDLILNGQTSPTIQHLKSPNIPQTQGTSFAGPPKEVANKHTPITHQSQIINKADKSKILFQSQDINNQNIPTPPPIPLTNKPKVVNQLQNIRDISQTKLKRVDESEKNKYSKSDRTKLLEDIREGVKLKPVIDISKNSNRLTGIALDVSNRIPLDPDLIKKMDKIRRAKDGSITPDPDWKEEVKTPFEIQEESSNKSAEDYAKNSNHDEDSGISDNNNSPERINANISKDGQPKISLPRSSSDNCIKGSMEQPKSFLSSHSSSSPNLARQLI
ncbi:hypothetical protein [Candidatus Mesenet endosymbiont of Agriotes lineatus]|uniref:hypothetical protein n=1 Tax=Candidatus Mesenet endosymbiont of Agriotes lineatus TaxID=3077948 RepID=UPI0030CCC62B